MTRVLVAGGGVAALEAILALRDLAEERVSIELVAPEPQFWYRPLAVLEPFGMGTVHGVELVEVAEACGAGFTLDSVVSVDADAHVAHTRAGAEFEYDAFVLASGARPERVVGGAFTFRGPADTDAFRNLLTEIRAGAVRHLVFAVPGGASWPLPLYELALLATTFLAERDVVGVDTTIVTPEDRPLALFGAGVSAAVARLLPERGIELVTGRYPVAAANGELALAPSGTILADLVVALPRLRGEPPDGIPQDADGFVPTDAHGRIAGLDDAYAAGDVTTFPVKQGGLAAQQARAVAEVIAAGTGAPLTPQPFRPILRGLLLTGGEAAYLRTDLSRGPRHTTIALGEPIWWPPAKIVGRHLAPFLAERGGVVLAPPTGTNTVAVEVDLSGAERAAVNY